MNNHERPKRYEGITNLVSGILLDAYDDGDTHWLDRILAEDSRVKALEAGKLVGREMKESFLGGMVTPSRKLEAKYSEKILPFIEEVAWVSIIRGDYEYWLIEDSGD